LSQANKWKAKYLPNSLPIYRKFDFDCKKGMAGATVNLYCGLVGYEDMAFLLHLLRETDLFVDVGANIGAFTTIGIG